MSPEQTPPESNAEYSGAHPDDRDPKSLHEIMSEVSEQIDAATPSPTVVEASRKLALLLDTKGRGLAEVSDEELDAARQDLHEAIQREQGPPNS